MATQGPKGPYRLVTVNNAPDRAKRLVGRVVEDLKDVYTIDYVGNCTGSLVRLLRLGGRRLLTRCR